jgi:maleate isomerase
MSLGFGTRARVGQLYPSGGLCDHEVQLMAPAGVQFLTTRVPFRRTGVPEDRAFADAVGGHAELLADAGVDLIAVNCTAATMIAGPARVRRAVHDRTGIPAVTTFEAVLGALAALGCRRVALVTPYVAEVVAAEVAHLADHGVEVVSTAGIPCDTPVEQGEIPAARWLELITGLRLGPGVDAVLLSCAGVQVAPVIDEAEARTGLPVVTSNQALLWWILETLGLPDNVAGFGRLLAERPAATM